MKRAVAAVATVIVLAGCASSTPPLPSVYVSPHGRQTPEQQVRERGLGNPAHPRPVIGFPVASLFFTVDGLG